MAASIGIAIAISIWWNANTIAHQCIHRPLFRQRTANACVEAVLTLLMGIPQSLWRTRHLAHHAGVPPRIRPSAELGLQMMLVLTSWTAMVVRAPAFFVSVCV